MDWFLMRKIAILVLLNLCFALANCSEKHHGSKKHEIKWEKCTSSNSTKTDSSCCWEKHCCVPYWMTGDFAKEYSEFQDNVGYKRCEQKCHDDKNFVVEDACGGDLCCVITRGRDDVMKRIGKPGRAENLYTFLIVGLLCLAAFLYGLGFACGYVIGRRMLMKAAGKLTSEQTRTYRLASSSLAPVQSPHHLQVSNAKKRPSSSKRSSNSNLPRPHKSSSSVDLRKGQAV